MKRFIPTTFLLLLIGTSYTDCKPKATYRRTYNTTYKVIDAIQADDPAKFISLIGVTDLKAIGKDEEMVRYDIKEYKALFEKYIKGNKPHIEFTQSYNHLGQRLVKVSFYDNKDSAIRECHLNLLFGPRNVIPLDKISGYELIRNNADSINFQHLLYWQK
jgi:hypothetical protein